MTARSLIRRLILEGDRSVDRLTALGPDAQTHSEELIQICHRMAGSAGTFGTRQLRGVLNGAEAALKGGDVLAASAALRQVPSVWQATRDALVTASAMLEAA